jgi:hypothetical protein
VNATSDRRSSPASRSVFSIEHPIFMAARDPRRTEDWVDMADRSRCIEEAASMDELILQGDRSNKSS